MVWQKITKSNLFSYLKRKNVHPLLPILTFILGVWLGMLTNPVVGAFCIALSLYLALVIYLPWEKISLFKSRVFRDYLIPAIITVLVIWPFWNKLVSIFPNSKQLKSEIEVIRDYSEVSKLDFTGSSLGLRATPPLTLSETPLMAMLKKCYIEKEGKCYPLCGDDAEAIYKKVIEDYPKVPFSYYALALCMKDRGYLSAAFTVYFIIFPNNTSHDIVMSSTSGGITGKSAMVKELRRR